MTTQTLPRLPLLPLKNVAIFPELIQALIVGRPASLAAVKVAIDHDRKAGDGPTEGPGPGEP